MALGVQGEAWQAVPQQKAPGGRRGSGEAPLSREGRLWAGGVQKGRDWHPQA